MTPSLFDVNGQSPVWTYNTYPSCLINSAPALCLSCQNDFTVVPFLDPLSLPSTCILLEALHFLVAWGWGCFSETAWQLVLEHPGKYSYAVRPVGCTDGLQLPLILHDPNTKGDATNSYLGINDAAQMLGHTLNSEVVIYQQSIPFLGESNPLHLSFI